MPTGNRGRGCRCDVAPGSATAAVPIGEAATGAPFGDAILLAAAAGLYESVEAAVKQFVRIKQEYTPDPAQVERYNDLYQVYRNLYPTLKSNFKELAALGHVD